MRKYFYISLFLFTAFSFSSCEDLFDATEGSNKPTEERIVEGLKKALEIGADSAVSKLNVTDGYYGFTDVRIPLPDEVNVITEAISTMRGSSSILTAVGGKLILDQLESKIGDVTIAVNRAAEYAAKEGGSIFVNAITNMSISEGWDVLNGVVPSSTKSESESEFDSTAATKFLEIQTRPELITAFSSPMQNALDTKLVYEYSANQLWTNTVDQYNSLAEKANLVSLFTNKTFDKVDTDLGAFVVGKALDGFFLRIGQEEKKIRNNPLDWAIDVIQDVFGYIKDQFEGK